jgi:hypothetical protein
MLARLPGRSPFGVCIVSLEQQVDSQLHIPTDRVAAAGQPRL